MTLVLSDICKSFGAVDVLKGISARFEPGTVTGIVGDNGAGKSTLLKILAGYHRPDLGSITLNGADLTPMGAHTRRNNGLEMVFQDLALAKQQDVATNLFIGREMTCSTTGILDRKSMVKKAKERLDRLGIAIPDLSVSVGALSGGQQQAVAIARAALFEPKVLLLDEPTAALAPKEVAHVLDLIRAQSAAGRIVILVSHRFNDVFAVADRIMVLRHGEIGLDVAARDTNVEAVISQIVA